MPISVSDIDAYEVWDHVQSDSLVRLGPGII
jgi:hypothetical protein